MTKNSDLVLIFPRALEPFNGIADHTANLQRELSASHNVRVMYGSATDGASGDRFFNAWPDGNLRNLSTLKAALLEHPPAAVVLQFEQFAYGERGFNPELPRLFTWLERNLPHTRRILFMHEAYTSPGTLGHTAMWIYQRRQARKLVRTAHAVLFASGIGIAKLGHLNPNHRLCPIPSALPSPSETLPAASPADSRFETSTKLTVGSFGFLNRERAEYVRAAVEAISEHRSVRFVYFGKDSEAARDLVRGLDVESLILGTLDEAASAKQLAQMDLALSPYPDGLTARRSSFMALLAHGVPTVTNAGRYTEPFLLELAHAGVFQISTHDVRSFVESATQLAMESEARITIRANIRANIGQLPSWSRTAEMVADEVTQPARS